MLGLINCATSQKKENSGTVDIYIPSFPDPADKDGKPVVRLNQMGDSVIVPLWYWNEIVRYASDVEAAAQALAVYNEE